MGINSLYLHYLPTMTSAGGQRALLNYEDRGTYMNLHRLGYLTRTTRALAIFTVVVFALVMIGCAPVTEAIVASDVIVAPSASHSSASSLMPTAMEVYERLAPSVAFVETETGTGSGPLIELSGDKYILTNAHVIWPFSEARIVFPDGSEYIEVPLVQTDQLVDLALLGPIDTPLQPLDLNTEQDLIPGEFTYLLGYPGEGELFPQPAITRGILSLTRVWDDLDSLRYYQTDTAGAGGQSGGILVSSDGDVIGISGMLFAEAFILSTSSIDILPRIDNMLASADDEIIRGVMPQQLNKRKYRGELENFWDTEGFVLEAPLDSEMEVDVNSESDYGLMLFNSYGEEIASADNNYDGSEVVSGTVTLEGPHYVMIEQYNTGESKYTLSSSHRFNTVDDPDDGQLIEVGETIVGNIDYPGDVDWYIVPLRRGERVVVKAESTAVDTSLGIGPAGEDYNAYTADDDSGRGLLGSNSLIEYRARQAGDHYVVVRAFGYDELGSFILTISDPSE